MSGGDGMCGSMMMMRRYGGMEVLFLCSWTLELSWQPFLKGLEDEAFERRDQNGGPSVDTLL